MVSCHFLVVTPPSIKKRRKPKSKFIDENNVTTEKPSDETSAEISAATAVVDPIDSKDKSDQPSAAESQPTRFKNSFNEVVEVKVF